MKTPIRPLYRWLAATTLCCLSLVATAMPKAAEHEDAPVTRGADVARPKPYAKNAKPPVTVKPRPAIEKKPANTARSSAKPKNVARKNP